MRTLVGPFVRNLQVAKAEGIVWTLTTWSAIHRSNGDHSLWQAGCSALVAHQSYYEQVSPVLIPILHLRKETFEILPGFLKCVH